MISLDSLLLEGSPTHEEGGRLLRTRFLNNKRRYIKRFIEPLSVWLQMNNLDNWEDIVQFYKDLWESSTMYTFKQAFEIDSAEFRALVFSSISVPEMVKELGSERISTEGIELINKTWNSTLNKFDNIDLTQIYELHKVNGERLGINTDLFAIKCWCTSTNDEHWLFTDKEQKPLDAIASTCKIFKSMENNIKHIIRQGDVFLFEMIKKVVPLENEEIISLNKDTYFKLLKSQS